MNVWFSNMSIILYEYGMQDSPEFWLILSTIYESPI